MALLKYIKRLQYMDYMIRRKATGDLAQFASKNRLSKRSMTDIICEMKELGFPIRYDRYRRTYFYDEAGAMVKHLFSKNTQLLTRSQVEDIGNDNLCFSETSIFEVCRS